MLPCDHQETERHGAVSLARFVGAVASGLRAAQSLGMTSPAPADLVAARRNLDQRAERRQARLDERWEAARRDAQKIVDMLIADFQPRRIYQWGSLLDRRRFLEISDIDLALEGITSPAMFFALLDAAERLTSFAVDIVQLEKIHPLHAQSIRAKGKLLPERPG